ncbi:MAG: polysaccharide deacetylase family protein [Candidatus Levybacteria bacterium]|nr:polysaccharide deacetylase family protein [Candidatus Levybacteria bacterium]
MSSLFRSFLALFAVIFGVILIPQSALASSIQLSYVSYAETKPQTDVPSEVEEFVLKQKKVHALVHLPTLRVPILMYHYVEYVKDEKDTTRIALNTFPHVLDLQIQTLKNAGFTFLTNKQLTEYLNGNGVLPEKSVVLTFDDGYRDFYTDAYPILKKHNAPATQYVVSGFFNDQNYMTHQQVLEIAKEELVEIGVHTETHPWLAEKNKSFLQKEVLESKHKLEKLIDQEIVSFAYPYGSFDVASIDTVKKAGFTSAVSVIPGIIHNQDTKYFLYRLRPGKRVGDELLNWIKGSTFTAF